VVTIVISLRTRPPADLDQLWLKMHGTAADRQAERLARLTIDGVSNAPKERP
jgi:cation/acetate symporter